jgi:membrane protease subunit HflK
MAWNDPQWGNQNGGNKNNGGPPDLDELWKKFNQRLNGLFGRKGGGSSGDEPPPRIGGGPEFSIPGGAGLVVALAVLVWLASGFYIVDAGERGVVLRFGKYAETTQPGPAGICPIRWKPWKWSTWSRSAPWSWATRTASRPRCWARP